MLILLLTVSAISAGEDIQEDTSNSNITVPDTSTDIDNQTIDNQTTPKHYSRKD